MRHLAHHRQLLDRSFFFHLEKKRLHQFNIALSILQILIDHLWAQLNTGFYLKRTCTISDAMSRHSCSELSPSAHSVARYIPQSSLLPPPIMSSNIPCLPKWRILIKIPLCSWKKSGRKKGCQSLVTKYVNSHEYFKIFARLKTQ